MCLTDHFILTILTIIILSPSTTAYPVGDYQDDSSCMMSPGSTPRVTFKTPHRTAYYSTNVSTSAVVIGHTVCVCVCLTSIVSLPVSVLLNEKSSVRGKGSVRTMLIHT